MLDTEPVQPPFPQDEFIQAKRAGLSNQELANRYFDTFRGNARQVKKYVSSLIKAGLYTPQNHSLRPPVQPPPHPSLKPPDDTPPCLECPPAFEPQDLAQSARTWPSGGEDAPEPSHDPTPPLIEIQSGDPPRQTGRLAHLSQAARDPVVEVLSAPEVPDLSEMGRREYERMKQASQEYLQRHRGQQHDSVTYRIQTDTPILLVHLADLHLGAEGTDHDQAERDALAVRETPGVFATFGGDGIDNFIKHQVAMMKATTNPAQQYAALGYWLSLFDDTPRSRLLGGVGGNHCHWTQQMAGLDFLRQLFRERSLVYAPFRLKIRLLVNELEYRVEMRHTFRFKSSINLGNQLQRMWEFSDWNWDLGLLGHYHDGPYVQPFERHGRVRWGGLAGAYKIHDAYAEQWGYRDARAVSPCFLLRHDRYDISGFKDLHEGIEVLKALRRGS